jgi:hypothetical protein
MGPGTAMSLVSLLTGRKPGDSHLGVGWRGKKGWLGSWQIALE